MTFASIAGIGARRFRFICHHSDPEAVKPRPFHH
jgi:hypothetical protein